MKTIIWSTMIFAMGCIMLFALSGMSINKSTTASEMHATPVHIHQIDVPSQDSSRIRIDPIKKKRMSFEELILAHSLLSETEE